MRPANDKTQPLKVAALFNQCVADLAAQGLHGAELFDKLAADPRLPLHFSTEDLAAIEGIQPDAVRQRRKRGLGPAYYKEGATVRTFRHDLCHHFKQKFVYRGQQIAAE